MQFNRISFNEFKFPIIVVTEFDSCCPPRTEYVVMYENEKFNSINKY